MKPSDALILVDLQKDFCSGGALAVPRGDEAVDIANRILVRAGFSVVVASQDWHPPDHVSFAPNHAGLTVGSTVQLEQSEQVLWPIHCVQGSRGAEFVDRLYQEKIGATFQKGTDPAIDSYSCFFDNHRRRSTGMATYLRRHRVDSVYLLGLATEYCLKYSALDALQAGFKTHVVLDGCRGIEMQEGDVTSALREMREAGVTLIQSDQLNGSGGD